MPHWTQESLRINRKTAEDIVDAYMAGEEPLNDFDYEKMIFEIRLRCACTRKKAQQYYAFVVQKKRMGM